MNYLYIAIGFLSAFLVIGLMYVLAGCWAVWKTRTEEREVIEAFCKKHDYCYFGCGRGDGGYYGGYDCNSDHK